MRIVFKFLNYRSTTVLIWKGPLVWSVCLFKGTMGNIIKSMTVRKRNIDKVLLFAYIFVFQIPFTSFENVSICSIFLIQKVPPKVFLEKS